MEEIKAMLVKLCEGQERLEQSQNALRQEFKIELNGAMNTLRQEFKTELNGAMNALRQEFKTELNGAINALRQEFKTALSELKKELLKEIRAVNQRLAACQLENGKKVDVLFDADETRKQLLEIHDEEIPEIKSTLFNYDIRIKNLESKVIGA